MTFPGAETIKAGIKGLEFLRLPAAGRAAPRCVESISSVSDSEELTEKLVPFLCPIER